MEQNQDEPESLLKNLRGHHIVHVHNPLTAQTDNKGRQLLGDFSWPVARSVVQADAAFADRTINQLGLRNDAHPTMKHVKQNITILSGQTMKLPGDVAQVVVKHLVDELINRSGNKKLTGDPVLRREYEELVMMNIDDLRSQTSTLTLEQQLEDQIKNLNKEETHERIDVEEQAFPGLQSGTGTGTDAGSSAQPTDGDKQLTGQKTATRK